MPGALWERRKLTVPVLITRERTRRRITCRDVLLYLGMESDGVGIRYTIDELLNLYQENEIAPDLVGRENVIVWRLNDLQSLEKPFTPICLTEDKSDELRKMWLQKGHNDYGNEFGSNES